MKLHHTIDISDHRGGTGYIPSASLVRPDTDDTYGVMPVGNEREVEYFIASDARCVCEEPVR